MPKSEMIKEGKLEENLYSGRPDYYPYNQEWMDEYFKEWSSKEHA